METISLNVNGRVHTLTCDPQMPLLWALRDLLHLTGAKYGCGIGACGLCTVHLDGAPARACRLPVGACVEREVVTIEGLSGNGDHPVQRAWRAARVPQCGYCQPGQIMNAVALLAANPRPTEADVDRYMNGVVCRCGTYPRIRKAIALAAAAGNES